MARSLPKCKGLPNSFWAKVVATAVYIINFSPSKAVKNKTPYQAWRGMKPSVSHLEVFGCPAYSLIPTQHHHKLDEKLVKCVFIGHYLDSKTYKLYNPNTCKIILSRDVVFHGSTS